MFDNHERSAWSVLRPMEDLRPHFTQSSLCLGDRVDPERGLGGSEGLQFLLDAGKQVNGAYGSDFEPERWNRKSRLTTLAEQLLVKGDRRVQTVGLRVSTGHYL